MPKGELLSADGDVFLDDGAWFCGCESEFGESVPVFGHEPVDGGSRDAQELFFDLFGDDELVEMWQPDGENFFESFGAGEICCAPDFG